MLFYCALVVGLFAGVAMGFPSGPPISACATISPNPVSHGAQPQAGNGAYWILTNLTLNTAIGAYSYSAGQTYSVQVRNLDGSPLRGFMVQARDPSDSLIGTFTPNGTMQALVNCAGGVGATIGHVNPSRRDFFSDSFTWTAPSGGNVSFVNFRFAVVRERATYYANQDAAQIAAAMFPEPPTAPNETSVVPPSTAAPTIGTGTTSALTYGPIGTTMTPGGLPASVRTPVRDLESYRITLRTPENCHPYNCDLFVGIDTNVGNSSWLDVHIQGYATTWVAVGFSGTNNMFGSDVLGCNVNPYTGMVDVLDTWNPPALRTNHEDASTQGVGAFSTSSGNGRIACTFARLTSGNNVGVDDLNLDQPLFLMFGIGSQPGALRSFTSHLSSYLNGGTPIRPGVMINPAYDYMQFGTGSTTASSAPVSAIASLFALSCSAFALLYVML